MNIFHNLLKISQTGIASFVNVFVSLVRTKLIALYTGTEGIGILGQLSNLTNIAQLTSSCGAQSGFVNEYADAERIGNSESTRQLKKTFFLMALSGSLVTAALIMIFARSINNWLFPGQDFIYYIRLVAINSIFLGPVLFFPSILQASIQIRRLMIYSILVSLVSTFLTIILLIKYSLDGVLYSFLLNSVMAILIGWWIGKDQKLTDLRLIQGERKAIIPVLIQLLKYGAAGLITSIAFQAGYTIIKAFLIREGGLGEAGLYQSVANISNQYLPILLTSLSTYLIPTLSGTQTDRRNDSIHGSIRAMMLLALPVVFILSLFSEFILNLLYSDQFSAGAIFLSWIIIADLLKVVNRVMGSYVIVTRNFAVWIFTDLVSISITVLITYILYPVYGLPGIAIAYIISQIFIFIVYLVSLRSRERFSISKRVSLILFSAFTLLLILNMLPEYGLLKKALGLTGLVLLMIGIVTHNERRKLLNRLKNKN